MNLTSDHQHLRDFLTSCRRVRPDSIAIEAIDRSPLTYRGLAEEVEHTRRALRSYGIGPADRVALVLPDGPEAAVMFLSVAACAVAAPLNPAYRAARFATYLDDLSARAVVVPVGSTYDVVEVARSRGIPIIEILPRGECAGAVDLFCDRRTATARESESVTPDSIALVLHTSGTTERPKLVPLTHRNLRASANDTAAALELGPSDRCLHIVPLFHIHGLVGALLSPLAAGGTAICTPGFQAARIFDWIDRFAPTWYTAVPAMHQAIADRAVQRSLPVSSALRFIRSVAAPLPQHLLSRLESVFAVPVIEGYGMTEASPQIACNPLPPRIRKPGSVGVAAGPEIAVMDELGLTLGPHQVGEIVVRGPNVTSGYERNPEANAVAFVNGWLRTGDQGYRDEDGYFFITGRLKEIINRGGAKIVPGEIDNVLLKHPSVAQAVTFSVPDKQLGETVAAAVVLRPGARLTQSQLRQFVASRLALFKVPYRIVFLHELPKGPTGKLQRIGLAVRLGLTDSDGTAHRSAPPVPKDPHSCEEGSTQARTSVEQALAQLWTAALQVANVGVHDDFFELGGNSISAVQILSQIRQRFGVGLRADVLFRAPTVARLAAKIEQHRSMTPLTASSGSARAMTSTERRLVAIWENVLDVRPIGLRDNFFELGGKSAHVSRLFAQVQAAFGEGLPVLALREAPTIEGLARSIDGTDRSESALIAPLQPHGSQPPLFAIHAGAGYVFFYRALAARLGGGVPFYAVQAQGHVHGRQRPFAPSKSVEQIAARYIREIKTIQRHGPYHLAGASFGGIVAFEMARQLRAQGETIDSLFLFSSHVRNNPHGNRDRALEDPGDLTWRVRVRARVAQAFRRMKVEIRDIDWRWRVLSRQPIPAELINARFMSASRALADRYRPGEYDGRVILFRAAGDKDPVPLWTGLAHAGLEVHDTPGGHLEMLDEPTVGGVADLIRAHIGNTGHQERLDHREEDIPPRLRWPARRRPEQCETSVRHSDRTSH